MEPHTSGRSAFVLPHSGQEPSPTHDDGFARLNAVERSAHAEMLHRAYSIWECKGRPEDSELVDWLAAEKEVLAER